MAMGPGMGGRLPMGGGVALPMGALLLLLLMCGAADPVVANFPLFDVSTQIRILLIPKDTPVGSVVYRLRATDSDFDYPLHFDVAGEKGTFSMAGNKEDSTLIHLALTSMIPDLIGPPCIEDP